MYDTRTSNEMDKYAKHFFFFVERFYILIGEEKENDMCRILSIFSTSSAVSTFFVSSAVIYQDMAVESYRLPGKVKFPEDQITQASLKEVFRKTFVVSYPGRPDFPPQCLH